MAKMIDKFTKRPDLEPGHYRHYKGGEYTVLMIACDEATHKWLVIYEALYGHPGVPKIWARYYDSFVENVTVDGRSIPRFVRVS